MKQNLKYQTSNDELHQDPKAMKVCNIPEFVIQVDVALKLPLKPAHFPPNSQWEDLPVVLSPGLQSSLYSHIRVCTPRPNQFWLYNYNMSSSLIIRFMQITLLHTLYRQLLIQIFFLNQIPLQVVPGPKLNVTES